ncbi:metaphase-anaphase transition protein [Colletotrichum tofieldiae]|uniref:Metaphase-anaphase transition protein n=1 Tax=Colletotrichum tofieldiae TaxID=708197 RepID=A0A166QJC8_9PEZI|nr:metaphase-anaphase transition protein [Colletotrichum tofieldiae]GKT60786.1 metaphase-anaphase transition protein [Colletotrichum tofieldiae]GKT68482.1 metaphase-anaphase transition protein [Colletotrichum tofieldiae]GKT90497.1 metaphase-anaphase transition protein [Colletotrichum tofieldiae]
MSMDPPPPAASGDADVAAPAGAPKAARSESFSSHKSNDSQTAAEFIRDQMQLEADAREALPYSIENCTKILGSLRQSVFACLTCNPPPANPKDPYDGAGVCYACSVQCHGEHTLVEIFTKRNFTCDCGTKRYSSTSPCSLRINPATNTKGGVHSEEPDANNKYNQNFRNRFCACECDYDPFQQKGTMFQCLGLGTAEIGGCGEDWYHPGCLVGLGPNWFEGMKKEKAAKPKDETREAAALPTISEDSEARPAEGATAAETVEEEEDDDDDDPPMPPGFPGEDDFEAFLCYKCVNANPWIRKYAGAEGFLPAVFSSQKKEDAPITEETTKKRKADDDGAEPEVKRLKGDAEPSENQPASSATEVKEEPNEAASACKWATLPPPPKEEFSLFMKEDFRNSFCRCSSCYHNLDPHPQLLEEEETYEPPLSNGANSEHGGSTNGSGSLLERGESALRNVDRVRAIEGVMAYNHLKEQLKPFFQQFAESGQAIGAEDIKSYFAKLRGDEQAIRDAGEAANGSKDDEDDQRKEQSGY